MGHEIIIEKKAGRNHHIVMQDLSSPIARPYTAESNAGNSTVGLQLHASLANVLYRRGLRSCNISLRGKVDAEFLAAFKDVLIEKGVKITN